MNGGTKGLAHYYQRPLFQVPPMSKFRNFCFTQNNYPNEDLVQSIDCKYIVYGREVAPTTGTPHLQGFIAFKNPRSLSGVRSEMPGCHVEIAATIEEAIAYAKKEGDFSERGVMPKSLKRANEIQKENWEGILAAASSGDFESIPAEIRFKYDRNIERIRDRAIQSRHLEDTEERHEWYYGPSGTGKSRKARTENPEAFLKMCNKWWDGYTDQETVLIEDFDKKHDVLCHHLKIWADRYPFPAEAKGRALVIRPKKIIITSNYHPKEIWTDESSLEPILRRFKFVHFDEYPPKKMSKTS